MTAKNRYDGVDLSRDRDDLAGRFKKLNADLRIAVHVCIDQAAGNQIFSLRQSQPGEADDAYQRQLYRAIQTEA